MENGICHSPPPTPSLVFGTNGGLGTDCNFKFLKRLAEKISQKNEEPCHITFTSISNLVPNSGKVPGNEAGGLEHCFPLRFLKVWTHMREGLY